LWPKIKKYYFVDILIKINEEAKAATMIQWIGGFCNSEASCNARFLLKGQITHASCHLDYYQCQERAISHLLH